MNKKIKFRIRRMEEKDIDDVYILGSRIKEFKYYPGSKWYKKKHLKGWLKNSNDVLLVAEVKGKLVGFILSRFHKETGCACLEEMMVIDEFRGCGIGFRLIEICMRELKKRGTTYFYLLTQTTNLKAIKFFEKQGFRKGLSFYWMFKEK